MTDTLDPDPLMHYPRWTVPTGGTRRLSLDR